MIQTLADALAKQGYDTLTPVQEACNDPIHEGQDLLVSAQTGSGKTVGFGLAIGNTILNDDGKFDQASTPLALIIAPTRELALQVKRELSWLYAGAGVVMASCVGGMDMRTEKRTLERGAHIVVATPGRLKDHILRGSLDMSAIRAIVLDEADEMLDLGFREDLEYILGEAPETRRTLMFSATVPPMIEKLAKSYQNAAIRISTVSKATQHADIAYRALSVAQHDADNAIINVLRFYEAPNAIVFCNTRAMVTRLTTRLSNRGFAVVALSGELSQNERSHALQSMRDGRARVCVATDVAARGIDLPNLELVVHAELPTNAETLMHRSGRTGRAGRKGISALIVPQKMRRRAENLLKWGKLSAEWAVPPTADEVKAKDEERLLTDPVWTEEFTEGEQEFATRLLAAHSAEQIAAAYLRLYAGKASAPEDLTFVDPNAAAPAYDRKDRKDRAEREPFGPSKWFSVDVGREGKAEARWLLPMICKAGDITKREIGAIRIQPNETFVEIKADAVPGFLKAVGGDMRLENQASLKALDGPPQISDRGARPSKRDYDKPSDRSTPPPSRAPDRDAIKPIPGAADDMAPPPPRKPRAKPARKDHGEALSPIKPQRGKDDGKPPYKAKTGYKGKPDGSGPPKGKPPHKGKPPFKSDGSKPAGKPPHKGDGGKPSYKGGAGKPAGKPRGNASDPSKRFVPPGGKPGGRPGGKGPNATPKRRGK